MSLEVVSSPVVTTPAPGNPAEGAVAAALAGKQEAGAAKPGAEGSEAGKSGEKDQELLSPRFGALAKKERGLVKLRQEVASERQAIEKRLAEIEEREKKLSDKPKNPIEALQRYGFTYEEATNFLLNGEKATPESEIKSVKEQLDAFRKEQAEKEERAAAEAKKQAEAAEAQAIEGFKKQISDFIAGNSEKYELIHMTGQAELVFDTIEAHFNETKRVMSITEASEAVENYLINEAKRITAAKKLQAQAEKGVGGEAKPQTKPASPTLSNHVTASSAPSFLPAKSEQERLQRALAALNGGA